MKQKGIIEVFEVRIVKQYFQSIIKYYFSKPVCFYNVAEVQKQNQWFIAATTSEFRAKNLPYSVYG